MRLSGKNIVLGVGGGIAAYKSCDLASRLVKEGARVAANDPLIVLEAMKTETTLSAESPAMVKRVCVQVGQKVDHGATLIELAPVPE